MRWKNVLVGLAVAASLSLTAQPASAAHWHGGGWHGGGWHRGGGWGWGAAGLGFGLSAGAALAAPYYGYGYPYAYGYPVYGYGYGCHWVRRWGPYGPHRVRVCYGY